LLENRKSAEMKVICLGCGKIMAAYSPPDITKQDICDPCIDRLAQTDDRFFCGIAICPYGQRPTRCYIAELEGPKSVAKLANQCGEMQKMKHSSDVF